MNKNKGRQIVPPQFKKHMCDECGSRYTSRAALTRHARNKGHSTPKRPHPSKIGAGYEARQREKLKQATLRRWGRSPRGFHLCCDHIKRKPNSLSAWYLHQKTLRDRKLPECPCAATEIARLAEIRKVYRRAQALERMGV